MKKRQPKYDFSSFDDDDIVVNPHELTDEDREIFAKVIEECRKRYDVDEISRKALEFLDRRRGKKISD